MITGSVADGAGGEEAPFVPYFEAVAVAAPAVAVAPAGELLGAVVVPGGEGVLVAVACGRAAFAL